MNTRKKTAFIRYCKTIGERNLSWGASGNMSMRVEKKSMYITRSGSHYRTMTTNDVSVCRITDACLLSGKKPSVEFCMHAGIYQKRPDIHIIIHVHPLYSILMTSGKAKINVNIIPEAKQYLGDVAYVSYIPSGTKKLADTVQKDCQKASLVVLRNHGIVGVGKTFEEVMARIEAFEFIAELTYKARVAQIPLSRL